MRTDKNIPEIFHGYTFCLFVFDRTCKTRSSKYDFIIEIHMNSTIVYEYVQFVYDHSWPVS